MALNFQFALGKNIQWIITPQDIAADGTHSNNAVGALSMIGRLEEANGGGVQLQVSELTPMDCFYDNPVAFGQSTMYDFTEFMALTGHDGYSGLLQKAIRASYNWKVNALLKNNAATPATKVTEDAYILMTNYDSGYRRDGARGRANGRTYALPTATPGVYTANPLFS